MIKPAALLLAALALAGCSSIGSEPPSWKKSLWNATGYRHELAGCPTADRPGLLVGVFVETHGLFDAQAPYCYCDDDLSSEDLRSCMHLSRGYQRFYTAMLLYDPDAWFGQSSRGGSGLQPGGDYYHPTGEFLAWMSGDWQPGDPPIPGGASAFASGDPGALTPLNRCRLYNSSEALAQRCLHIWEGRK